MLVVQTATIVLFLGNEIKFSSAVLIFGSRSMVALYIGIKYSYYIIKTQVNMIIAFRQI